MRHEKIELENFHINKFIEGSKSSVARKDLQKSYESNRVL
jgi:hypothetical protein